MSLFHANRFVASLTITALTVTSGLTPVVAMANDAQVKSTYNVQSTQSLINTLTRLGGYDRYGTAVQIADHGWKSASTAVLAPSGDRNMVDALTASSLAKAVDGPILLADIDSVPSSTLAELKKLGVTKVYLVSGTAVMSTKVESELTAAGIQSIRLGGYDRYETAVNIAREIQKIKPFQEVVVTNAYANVDAISIAPIAAAKGIPVLLVDKDSVPKVVSDFIKASGINKTYVIGGTAVVSDSVKDALPNAMRLGGNDRFDTNKEVLKQFENLIVGGSMFFANGSDTSLIDSLTGAPVAAKLGGAIVLSNKDDVPDGTKGLIQTDISLKNPVILGGTAVMSDSVVQNLAYAQPGQSAILNGAVELNTPNATFKDVTVNGNILIDADGETLQNVIVNGTVFVDPGKDGSAILDGVKATRIVVLSGADHSVDIINTTSDSLVVSSSSPDTHVVAGSGTTFGSTLVQSNATVESQTGSNVGVLSAQPRLETPIALGLQGTFSNDVALSGSVNLTAEAGAAVSNVNVTNAASPDAMQLAGQFASISVTDSSPVTVISGTVARMTLAAASRVVVNQGVVVTSLSSSAGNATLSGRGTVNGNVTTDTPTSTTIPVTQTTPTPSNGNVDRGSPTDTPPAITNVTSPTFALSAANNTVTITLTGGTFKAGSIAATDFTFAGTDAAAFAAGTFTRVSNTVVTITNLTGLTGVNNTVLVKAATQATQAASVTAVATTRTISQQFPDENLASEIASWLGLTVDDLITKDIIEDYIDNGNDYLELGRKGISDMTGFEIFNGTNLESLELYENNLTSFDATGLTNLELLTLAENQISNVNVSNLTHLTNLGLRDNPLTNVNVIGLTTLESLETLNVSSTGLTSLDVSGLTNLYWLVYSLPLTSDHITGFNNVNQTEEWTVTPVITTAAQTVNTDTITIVGTAEDNAAIRITGGSAVVNSTADESGAYSSEVTLTHDAINHLRVYATGASGYQSRAARVDITHVPSAEVVNASISAAELLIPDTVLVAEGTDTNLLTKLNSIGGMGATGVTLTLDVTGNANVSANGTITYTDSQVVGNVIVKINKTNGTEQTKTVSVTVPARAAIPDGVSAPTTVAQRVGSTSVATINITDDNSAEQDVNHYKVFVAQNGVPGINPSIDKYQTVLVGAISEPVDINLGTLINGAVTPANGETPNFWVVAYNAAGNPSVPAANDKATVTWDKSVAAVALTDYVYRAETGVNANDGRIDANVDGLEIGEDVTLQYIIMPQPQLFPVQPAVNDAPTGIVEVANVPADVEIASVAQVITGLDGNDARTFSGTTVDTYIRYVDVYGNTGNWVKVSE